MGEILNISAARGSAKSFDFASAALAADDKLVFKATNGQAPLLVKMNKNFGGDDSQITITAGTKVTVLLSISELDLLQTCNYQLFKITDLAVTLLFSGTFTITGDKTNQALAVSSAVPFQNGTNQRYLNPEEESLSEIITVNNNDDYIIVHNDVLASLVISLPDAHTNAGKIFHIKNDTANTEGWLLTFQNATPQLKNSEEVTLISDGSIYQIWGYKKVESNKNPPLITADYEIEPGNDTLIVSSEPNLQPINISVPADRTSFFGKHIVIKCDTAGSGYPVNITDAATANVYHTFTAPGIVELYLTPGTATGDNWTVIQ